MGNLSYNCSHRTKSHIDFFCSRSKLTVKQTFKGFSMRRIAATVLACSLFASASAYAADSSLAPGKPAGVMQAQMGGDVPTIVFLGVMAGIVATIAIASSDEKVTPVAVATTTTTS